MLLFISSLPSRRKLHPKRILHLVCDACGHEYEKRYFAHIESAPYHLCSEKCQALAQQKGGFLDIKKRQVMFERYGVENPQQSNEIRERTRQTNLERYGSEISSRSDIVKSKMRQTNRTRYGVSWHTQSQNFATKARETWQENYGVDHPMKSEEVKAKYDFYDLWRKAHETKKLNGTYATSKAESLFYEQLIRIFDVVKRQASIQHERGTWLIDFYLPDIDAYVQFDGVYWHGLDRPLCVIKESTVPRDLMIRRRYNADRIQDAWFRKQGLTLVRITDRQAKSLSDVELVALLTLAKES